MANLYIIFVLIKLWLIKQNKLSYPQVQVLSSHQGGIMIITQVLFRFNLNMNVFHDNFTWLQLKGGYGYISIQQFKCRISPVDVRPPKWQHSSLPAVCCYIHLQAYPSNSFRFFTPTPNKGQS